MHQLVLVRLESRAQIGTFGTLMVDTVIFCSTLEPPDRENRENVSSIPAGQYLLRRYHSKKYPDTFQVIDVTDRTKVVFHAGNWKEDTKACILLGQYPAKLAGRRAVANSGNTFRQFMELMGGDQEAHLTIREAY